VAPLRRRGDAIAVRGLSELQRALRKAEGNTGKNLRKALREVAKDVRDAARGNVEHRTGRHGGADVPRLGPSIKAGVTAVGASIYSNAPHSIVQDQGGQVGIARATLLKRASVSRYMTRAVVDSQPTVERKMDEVLDELGRDFEG